MKKWLFIFMLCSFSWLSAQKTSVKLLKKTAFRAEQFVGVDKFNNYYGITNNVFYKYHGNKKYQFTDLQLGELTSADILNPLRITLFYKNVNTVVILDNRLNEITRINFNTIANFRTVGFATTANNQSLWIFNVDLQQLEVFNYTQNKVSAHTQPFSTTIKQHASNFNFCWILDQNFIEKYNIYGSLVTKIPHSGLQKIAGSNGQLIALGKKGHFYLLPKNGKIWQAVDIPSFNIVNFALNANQLFVFDGKSLFQYQLNFP